MTEAGKFQLIQELYDSGALCLCVDWVQEYEDLPIELVHKEDCIGRDKVKELLNS